MLTHTGTQTIETERLLLRRFCFSDCEGVCKNWAGDKLVQSMYHEPVYATIEETKQLLENYINSYEKQDYYRWAVILKEEDTCIGQIAFFLVDNNNMLCEIEFCVGRAYQNKGYITEATKAVIAYGFEKVNFNRIQITHREANNASKRVIEKCGFTYEGALRKFFYRDGKFYDRLYYSILKNDWRC